MRKAADYTRIALPINIAAVKKLGRPDWEKDFANNHQSIHADVAESHDRSVAEVLADRNLSEHGRAAAIRKVKLAHVEKLDRLDQELVGGLRTRVAAMEVAVSNRVAFQKPTDPAERIAFELRQREIRDAVRHMDPVQRRSVFLETTDAETREALETAPPVLSKPTKERPVPGFESFIDPETVEMVRTTRIRRAAPEVVEEIQDLTSIANFYAGLLAEVRRAILDEMPKEEAATTGPRPQATGDAILDAGLLRA